VEVLILAAISILAIGAGLVSTRNYRRQQNLIRLLAQSAEPLLYCDYAWNLTSFQVAIPGVEKVPPLKAGLLVITAKRLAIYDPKKDTLVVEYAFAPGELRGFWRPEKYRDGLNHLWAHVQIGYSWQILRLYQNRGLMQDLVRAFKQIATPEQTKAYRRQRPYVYREPAAAFPAEQNLQGAWELDERVDLYLMPLYLVIFRRGSVVEAIDLHFIQEITALPRMDTDGKDGLLRFTRVDTGSTLAFALKDYAAWAADVAQAAKRTLEEPVLRKQKNYEDDDEIDSDAL
jgi:hypothetical protein